MKELKESICDTAPYPWCNGAEGCENCEHQEVNPTGEQIGGV